MFAEELAEAEVETEAIIAAEEQRLAQAEPADRDHGYGADPDTRRARSSHGAHSRKPSPKPRSNPKPQSSPGSQSQPQAALEPHAALEPQPAVELRPAFEPRAAFEPPAAVEPPAAFEPQAALEPHAALEPQPAFEPPAAVAPRPAFEPPAAYEPHPEVEARCASEPEFEIEPEAALDVESRLASNVPVQLEPLPPPRTKKKTMRGGRAASIARQRAHRDGEVGREAWASVARELIERGVTAAEAERLAMEAAAHGIPLARASALRDAVREMLARQLTGPASLPASGAAVAFVGAGGAGKTRCAAALASAYRRASTLSVIALSLGDADDGHTIETLLKPEGVPVRTAVQVRSVRRLVSDGRAGGVVIVDTPAIGPGDRGAVLTLAEQLEPLRLDGVFVAVPATIGPQAARQLLSALGPLHPTGIAVTHLDETDQLGVAVELACATGTPIAYVHEGLDLRRALSAPDPLQLAARLLP